MRKYDRFSPPFWIVFLTGILFVGISLLFSESVLRLLSGDGVLASQTILKINETQKLFAITGIALILSGLILERFFKNLLEKVTPFALNLLLLFSVIFSIIFILENGIGVIYKSPDKESGKELVRESAFQLFEYDSILGWKNKPGSSSSFIMPDSKTFVAINKNGFREFKDFEYRKDGIRAIFIGDSFAWDYGVEQNNRFSDIIRNQLENKVEIINTGVNGYGLDQELLFYEHFGYKFNPDYVFTLLGFDDIGDLLTKEGKPYFTLIDGKAALHNKPVKQLKDGRFLKDKKTSLWTRLLSYSNIYKFVSDRIVWKLKQRQAVKLMEPLLLRFKNSVESNGSQLYIILKPNKAIVQSNLHSDLYFELKDFLKNSNIAFIDPLNELQTRNWEVPVFFKYDSHWNNEGHRVVAKGILDFLKDEQRQWANLFSVSKPCYFCESSNYAAEYNPLSPAPIQPG